MVDVQNTGVQEEVVPVDPAAVDGVVSADSMPVELPEEPIIQNAPDENMIQGATGAAAVANMAGVGLNNNTYSATNMLSALGLQPYGTFGKNEIEDLLSQIKTEDIGVQKKVIMDTLNRRDLDVNAKLALSDALASTAYDVNIFQRQAMHNANIAENSGYTNEDKDAYDVGIEQAARVPTSTPDLREEKKDLGIRESMTDDEAKAVLEELVRRQYNAVEEKANMIVDQQAPRGKLGEAVNRVANVISTAAGVSPITKPLGYLAQAANSLVNNPRAIAEFGTTMAPFYEANWMADVYGALGLDYDLVMDAGGKLAVGTAYKLAAQHIKKLSPTQRLDAFQNITGVIKKNSWLFKDGNNYLQMYMLYRLFPEELGGQYAPNLSEAPDSIQAKIGALRAEVQTADYAAERSGSDVPKNIEGKRKELAALEQQYGSGGVGFEEFIQNFGSISDMGMLLSPARRGYHLFKNGVGSVRALNKTAPGLASKTFADMMLDPMFRQRVTDKLGPELAEGLFPVAQKGMLREAVDGVGGILARQEEIANEIANSYITNLSMKERKALNDDIANIWKEHFDAPKSHVNTAYSVITPTDKNVSVSAAFGRADSKPFATLGSAKKASKAAVERIFGVDAKTSIRMIDEDTGKLVDVPEGMADTTKGRFFHVVDEVREPESSPTLWHRIAVGDSDISPSMMGVNGGSAWNYLKGSFDKFSADVVNPIVLKAGQRQAWNRITFSLAENVRKLGKKDWSLVGQALEEGTKADAKTGMARWLTPTELAEKGISKKGQRAYYEVRNALDILHPHVNRAQRNRLFNAGAKDIQSPTGRVGYGVVRDRAGTAISDFREGASQLAVFDAAKGEYVKLSAVDITRLYDEGKQLARLQTPMVGATDEATHVIVDGKATRALELPQQVVPKLDGYIPQIWQGNYIIHGTTAAGNRVAVGIAQTLKDAREAVARLQQQARNAVEKGRTPRFAPDSIAFDLDRSLRDPTQAGAFSDDIYVNMRGPVFGTRNGGALENFSKSFGEAQLDPIESTVRALEIVGLQVTKGELADQMYTRLYNFASTHGLLKNKQIAPQAITREMLTQSGSKSKEASQALAYLDQIEMLRRVPDAADQFVSKAMLGAANAADTVARFVEGWGKIGKMLSSPITKVEGLLSAGASKAGNPANIFTGLVHRVKIAANPINQHALQLSQIMLMVGVAPMDMPKAIAAMHSVWSAAVFRNSTYAVDRLPSWLRKSVPLLGKADEKALQKGLDQLAKFTPFSKEELSQVVDVLSKTGLLDSTGVHMAVRQSVTDAATANMRRDAAFGNRGMIGQVAGAVKRTLDAPFQVAGAVGFEAGEQIARTGTFLALHLKNKRIMGAAANLAEPDYIRKLVGDTYKYTGSMLPETSYKYQRGWLKAFFQFWSFNHKMVNLMLLDKTLTPGQKLAMTMTQAMLFGRRATAATDVLYRAIDTKVQEAAANTPDGQPDSNLIQAWNDPAVRDAIDGGLADWSINRMLEATFGDKVGEYEFSRRFAPGGGYGFLVDGLASFGHMNVAGMTGISGEVGSKFYSYLRKQAQFLQAQALGGDVVPYEQRLKNAVDEGLMLILPSYSKYVAVQLARAHYGYVASNGRIGEAYDGAVDEALFKMFGVMSKDRQALYDAIDDYEADMMARPDKKEAEMDKLVDLYFKDAIYQSGKLVRDGVSDDIYDNMMGRWMAQRSFLFSLYAPDDAEKISDRMVSKMQTLAQSKDSAERAFVEKFARDLQEGRLFDKDARVMLQRLETNPAFRDRPELLGIVKDQLREGMDIGGEE